jgi:anti-anti-sigma regulatory factor
MHRLFNNQGVRMAQIGQMPIVVLETQSFLDSSNCQLIIEQATEAYKTGCKRLVLDLQHTNAISTHGLFAIHTIVSLLYDEPAPTLDLWTSSSATILKATRAHALNKRLLIRNPKPQIAQALYAVGFNDYAEILASAD